MFITLISPPTVHSFDSEFFVGRRGGPPLNLGYLSAALERAGIPHDVIDAMAYDETVVTPLLHFKLKGMPPEEIVARIDPRSKVVGIASMFTCEWLVVRELARMIKTRFPDVILIIGGEHATAAADSIIRFEKDIDYCFLGEADETLVEFVKALPEGRQGETPGIVRRAGEGGIVTNPRPRRIRELDSLVPRWDQIPVDYYLSRKLSYSRLGHRAMPILATRGCPYLCTFCTNEQMWGGRYVKRSVDSVISEMLRYRQQHGVEHFDFLDLSTAIDRKWFKELLERMIRDLPGISWEMTVGTRAEILDREILTLLKRSGTKSVCYAPETGSASMAAKVKKKLDHARLYRSVADAVDLGFDVKANVILGFPGETFRELAQTLWMVLRLGASGVKGVSVFKFTPYFGSALGDELGYRELTAERYEQVIQEFNGVAGARVFNLFAVLREPREQMYAFLSNSFMVASFLLSAVRRPSYLIELWRNVRGRSPECAFEVAVFYLLKRYGVMS